MSPLRWTCKSLRRLAAELDNLGHKISHTVVGELLKKQKFSLQANRKTREGAEFVSTPPLDLRHPAPQQPNFESVVCDVVGQPCQPRRRPFQIILSSIAPRQDRSRVRSPHRS